MAATTHHLAQVNLVQMRTSFNDPIMADFIAALAPINQLAEQSPGFVWRYIESPDDPAPPIFDASILVNLSVWDSIDALFNFTYSGGHLDIFRKRQKWFTRPTLPQMALWWIPATHTPTPTEAKTKIEHLAQHGPTPHAFTLKRRFTIQDLLNYA